MHIDVTVCTVCGCRCIWWTMGWRIATVQRASTRSTRRTLAGHTMARWSSPASTHTRESVSATHYIYVYMYSVCCGCGCTEPKVGQEDYFLSVVSLCSTVVDASDDTFTAPSSLPPLPPTYIYTYLHVAPAPRGDLEILAYCLLQWSAGSLPWEQCLHDKDRVAQMKIR